MSTPEKSDRGHRKIRDEAGDLERSRYLTARQRRQRHWQERQRGWTHAGLIYLVAGVELPPAAVRVLGLPAQPHGDLHGDRPGRHLAVILRPFEAEVYDRGSPTRTKPARARFHASGLSVRTKKEATCSAKR